MNYNIYFSPTGGTKRVADILVRNLNGEFCDVDICRDIEKMTLQAGDVCLVSVPSFAGRVPQIAIERIKKIVGNGAKAILNCVYGNREWDDTLTELQEHLKLAALSAWLQSPLLPNTPSSVSLPPGVLIVTMPKSWLNLPIKSQPNLKAVFMAR